MVFGQVGSKLNEVASASRKIAATFVGVTSMATEAVLPLANSPNSQRRLRLMRVQVPCETAIIGSLNCSRT